MAAGISIRGHWNHAVTCVCVEVERTRESTPAEVLTLNFPGQLTPDRASVHLIVRQCRPSAFSPPFGTRFQCR
ncbi:protein of unknown function [Methylocaldum szegediense]|uniref:Uncharacterized protein n=1 Tax=Methylocaldum szegediense TaxID=73780 RepID=A0ABN8XFC9_9GAMM|nr:protein of unknown function [Methylocaldum szegediense]